MTFLYEQLGSSISTSSGVVFCIQLGFVGDVFCGEAGLEFGGQGVLLDDVVK